MTRSSTWAACTSSAPSGTRAAGSTTSCAAAPVARVIPASRAYLSLGDDLMRRFQGERVQGIMERLRIPDDVPIEAGIVTKSIERAQRQVEAQNFEIRKNVSSTTR